MSKKFKIILSSIISAVVIAAVVITIVCINLNNKITPEIYAEDLTVEFDGKAHKINASANVDGAFVYNYSGVNFYHPMDLEPVQPGEYEVEIRLYPNQNDVPEITKDVKLTITFPYEFDETGSILMSYNGSLQNIVLPSKYNDKEITGMSDDLFSGKTINSIEAPDSVFSINPKIFDNTNITKLIIKENTKLLDGTYPSNLQIEFSGNFKTLHDDTFGEIVGFDEITIPSTITKIEKNALSKIKASKLYIYSNTRLLNCNLSSTLKSVYVYSDSEGVLAQQFFENCTGVEKIELDENIIELGERAFYNCSSLKELTINSKIEEIYPDCFEEDFCLEKLNIDFKWAMLSNEHIEVLEYFKLGLKTIEVVEIMECEIIPRQAFFNCSFIKTIVLPDSVEVIERSAFFGCINLSQINFPEKLKSIGDNAFNGCESLEEIVLPSGINTLGWGAFSNCENLKKIELPAGIDTLPDSLFLNCTNLKTVVYNSDIIKMGELAFYGCKKFTFQLPHGIKEIGPSCFNQLWIEGDLILPETVDTIFGDSFDIRFITGSIVILNKNVININTDVKYLEFDNYTICVPGNLVDEYQNRYPQFTFEAIIE